MGLNNIDRRKLGILGEEYAASYIIEKGYEILYRNYRCIYGEIDIVARKNNTIVFVEVKTRRNLSFGLPMEAVDKKKQSRYRRISMFYIKDNNFQDYFDYRFDVVEVYFNKLNDYRINYIENAF